ncbi:MAG: sugar nucleotide-binding protein [Sphingomonadales bacterium]|nr:sugar nucleotide-binding protein [Sphingomonadales bacterium]
MINLIGILKGRFAAVHVAGARNLAVAARDAGALAFVQVSAIGASAASASAYGRSKAEGEAAIRATFPSATIIRPSLVFGPEDDLTNRFARLASWPVVPVIAPRTCFQPIYVRDLANAIATAALDPTAHAGETYELGGPEVMTMRALNERIAAIAGQSPDFVDLPHFASDLIARFGFLPGAPLTRDQWLMLQQDNVASVTGMGLNAFEVTPTPLASVAGEWLGRYRQGGRFAPRRLEREQNIPAA